MDALVVNLADVAPWVRKENLSLGVWVAVNIWGGDGASILDYYDLLKGGQQQSIFVSLIFIKWIVIYIYFFL